MFNQLITYIFNSGLAFNVLVFVATVLASMVVLSIIFGAVELRRRSSAAAKVAGPAAGTEGVTATANSEDAALPSMFSRLLPVDAAAKSELRKFLFYAGFESKAAPTVYQLTRIAIALGLGFVTVVYCGTMLPNLPFMLNLVLSIAMAYLGFYLPKTLVSLRRDSLIAAHREGFPDFLDLMVICADAGIGVESSIDRVSKELAMGHPSLARNLAVMSLEMRAGRSRVEALRHLSERLGIEEARSFATLLQQSEELGTSLVQALRVYSDEMRAKRFARAEEKAMGLPAKLVLPLGLCVFPVILAVVLLPVAIRLLNALSKVAAG